MLRYITITQLKNEIPEAIQGLATSDDPNSTTIVESILLQKALDAEQVFESYVSRRYAIPVKSSDGTIPESVKQFIYTVTKYNLYARRNQITVEVKEQYDAKMRWIRDVATSKADIPLLESDGDVEFDGSKEVGVGFYEKYERSQFNKFV